MATERVEHGAQHQAIEVEVLELAAEHSPTRVLSSLVERDEAEEDLTGDLVSLVAEAGQQSLGARHQRAGHPAELLVGRVVDAVAAPVVEHLGQRVLQQRQCAGPIGHLPNQGRHERRLERDAERLRRAGDRPFQVDRCHRSDDLGPVAEQLAETSVLQRPVVEVGAKRDDRRGCDSARR